MDVVITPINAIFSTCVTRLHEEMRDYWRTAVGATRFVEIQTPVIPLGVDAAAFAPRPGARSAARAALALAADAVVFLFAGRLSFHAKANPAPVYQALEKAARGRQVVCIEAGMFANEAIREAFFAAQAALAPSVRFIWIDGQDEARYRQSWQGADVFVSLSDNIQETFGITPLEAMAAALPVLVSDWDGYKDTVRDGIDGLRVPTILPPPGSGELLALRHALRRDSYDSYIGYASMGTVVDPAALAEAVATLAGDPDRRARMGAAAQARAAEFDWPVILDRYAELTAQLDQIRQREAPRRLAGAPQRADPYRRFAHYATRTLERNWLVRARPDAAQRLGPLLSLAMTNYIFGRQLLAREEVQALLSLLASGLEYTAEAALAATGIQTQSGIRALMWLWKFDLIAVRPPPVDA